MSWWVYLEKNGKPVDVTPHEEGGTFALGGINEAELNITYNYSSLYYRHLDKKEGLEWLNGKKAKNCIEALKNAVLELGIQRDTDYWKATPGNAGIALDLLLRWAELNPETIFRVS